MCQFGCTCICSKLEPKKEDSCQICTYILNWAWECFNTGHSTLAYTSSFQTRDLFDHFMIPFFKSRQPWEYLLLWYFQQYWLWHMQALMAQTAKRCKYTIKVGSSSCKWCIFFKIKIIVICAYIFCVQRHLIILFCIRSTTYYMYAMLNTGQVIMEWLWIVKVVICLWVSAHQGAIQTVMVTIHRWNAARLPVSRKVLLIVYLMQSLENRIVHNLVSSKFHHIWTIMVFIWLPWNKKLRWPNYFFTLKGITI